MRIFAYGNVQYELAKGRADQLLSSQGFSVGDDKIEIAFDDIHPSSRHKSGIALRFPRIHRLRLDKALNEANTLEDAKKLC